MRSSQHGAPALPVLALLLAVALTSCARGPRAVPLDELAADPDAFHGQTVSLTGHVREIEDDLGDAGRHFVIEDGESNRVRLLPDEAAEPYAGQFVRVVGAFAFDEGTGRRLEVETIERPAP
ncbi:MAG TPA: hypothetical protein VNU01_03775 [Egibacteraceae bacterium]|nr:hypothetical protein [Egibacteraceae bacterium]